MKIIILFIAFLLSTISQAQTENIICSGDSKLHYKIFGKGKPILVINGGPGMSSDGFASIALELSKMNFQTILYDQRGTGKSTVENPNNESITMSLMVEDIENLRKHLKIDKWTIFGHSFGGIMETYYASKHPETIDKLIFSSSGGVNMKFLTYLHERLNNNLTKNERDSLNIYQQKLNSGNNSEETLKIRAKYLSNAYVYNKSNASIIADRLTQINFKINALVIENLQRINFDCTNSFKDFKQSVLVLQGNNDIISVETAEEIANSFPNSKLVLFDNCAHYGWLDAKEIYLKTIENFLNL